MSCEALLESLENSILPPRGAVVAVLENVRLLLLQTPNVIEIPAPVNIVGDLHGQFYDFLHMLEISNPGYGCLFLGDYVDRGYNSVELILYVLILKQLRPHAVHMLRGNHENRAQTAAYGFREECLRKYDEVVYWRVCEIFELLPLAAIVGGRFFCVHGGITPGLSLEALESADRMAEFPEMGDVMWADPTDEAPGFMQSQRGAGFLFGRQAVRDFLARINKDRAASRPHADAGEIVAIVRSHQLVFEGVREQFGKTCITVWSAPNYCYKCKNLAAIMIVEADRHEYLFYGPVKEQFKGEAGMPLYFAGQQAE